MNISPTTRTIITYAIELNDDEVGEILADPSAFQKQLRAIRATQANGKHGAKNITIGSRKKLGGGVAQKVWPAPSAESRSRIRPGSTAIWRRLTALRAMPNLDGRHQHAHR